MYHTPSGVTTVDSCADALRFSEGTSPSSAHVVELVQ
jgi:hypothetical protein